MTEKAAPSSRLEPIRTIIGTVAGALRRGVRSILMSEDGVMKTFGYTFAPSDADRAAAGALQSEPKGPLNLPAQRRTQPNPPTTGPLPPAAA